MNLIPKYIVAFFIMMETVANMLASPTTSLLLKRDDDVQFFYRQEWGARPATSRTTFVKTPIFYLVAHTGGPTSCYSVDDCLKLVKNLQTYCMDTLGYDDIIYNFLIGGDGNIYEGTGFDYSDNIRRSSLSIAYIGNFIFDELSEKMAKTGQSLIYGSLALGKLDQSYKIIGHNHTRNTVSPGVNVYKEIMKWPGFYSGRIP